MTTFNLDNNEATYQIRAYQPGAIKVNDKILTSSIIISENKLIENWQVKTIDELTKESLSPVSALKPDILLIGTGRSLVFISVEIYGHFINEGIGVEVMSTSAACRTYNALTAENRHVVAALIL